MAADRRSCILVAYFLVSACTAYVIDDSNGLGREFDGIGGLSGGGATSKLLVNYPEKQRNEILDYLFKPNYGASLQILKVEIGGDSQSTDGTESSHMHESWDLNFERGYEWWLMLEAKKRNPDIVLYGLPWAFPGWLGGATGNPYADPATTAAYIVQWLIGAQKVYKLHIDYIGIWNERQYDVTYIKTLRKSLNDNGFASTKIVASDNKWNIVSDLIKDDALKKIVDVVGVHYPGTESIAPAQDLGTALWASEDYSTENDNVGGGCWARILNQNYVNGLMTSTISWNLIASYYENLPFKRCALMTADQPWSGYYEVNTPIWVTAHTTQFVGLGWQYLAHGAGTGHLDGGGSYVSLTDPNKQHLTIVIETMSHDHSICIRPKLPAYNVTSQTAVFKLQGSWAQLTELNVWYSKIGFDGQPDNMFQKQGTIKVQNGTLTLPLSPDELYTLTSVPGGQKGDFGTPPPPAPFPLPYKDDFNSYPLFSEAPDFAPQVGVWEVRDGQNHDIGNVNRQVVMSQPVDWCRNTVPINMGGNYNWSDVYVQADVMVPVVNGSDGVFVAARVTGGGCGADKAKGVFLHLNVTTKKFLLALDSHGDTVVTSGSVDASFGKWYTLTLMIRGSTVHGYMDLQKLFATTITGAPSNGFVAYGTNRFGLADFDNFMVEGPLFIPSF